MHRGPDGTLHSGTVTLVSIAERTDGPVEVVVWQSAEQLVAASFAAQLAQRGITVRRVAAGDDRQGKAADDLLFVAVQGRLLVDPTPAAVALLVKGRTLVSAGDAVRVPDGRSATLTMRDVFGVEHDVVVVDRVAGSVCALLEDGALTVASAADREGAMRALARRTSTRIRSAGPDGLDRLRLSLLAMSGRTDAGNS